METDHSVPSASFPPLFSPPSVSPKSMQCLRGPFSSSKEGDGFRLSLLLAVLKQKILYGGATTQTMMNNPEEREEGKGESSFPSHKTNVELKNIIASSCPNCKGNTWGIKPVLLTSASHHVLSARRDPRTDSCLRHKNPPDTYHEKIER